MSLSVQIIIWILAWLLFTESTVSSVGDKVWSVCEQNGEECTACGVSFKDAILCSNDTLQIQPCYCMYYDPIENRTIAGKCMTTCCKLGPIFYKEVDRYSVENATKLNDDVCGLSFTSMRINIYREGRFCGKCKRNYGLAVYSYHYISCIPCVNSYKNWLKYIAVAYVPLTIFYFLVVLLKIDFTSNNLACSVFGIQCILSPVQLRILDMAVNIPAFVHLKYLAYALFSVFGVLNLDFFRLLYPDFCLHPDFGFIHVVSLDFVVALYPFFLIFLTYLLVTMYDRNYRLVVWAWMPFKYCLKHYWRGRNVKGSLIQTFGSFVLLSNVKILGVCCDLLGATTAYDATGAKISPLFLYYDATIEYFGSEHWPFAVLALSIGFMFVVLPFLLLVIYPCRCFQRALNCLGWRCQALHIFMDVFQGSYKTEPHDLRYFSAYYLLLRFLILLLTAVTASLSYATIIVFLLVVAAIIFALFEPYKNSFYNKVDVALLLTMVLWYAAIAFRYSSSFLDRHWLVFCNVLIAVFSAFCVLIALTPTLVYCLRFFKQKILCLQKQKENSETSVLIDSFNRA